VLARSERDALVAGLLLCEAASLASAWSGRGGPALALHALALPLALALARRCGPASGPRRAALAPTLLVATLPAAGALLLVLVLLPAWRRPRLAPGSNVLDVGAPREIESAPAPVADVRGIRDVLVSSCSLAERLEAVLALRRLPARAAVPILRLAFADRSEDVRLLAFADLERRESKLRARVQELRAAVASAELTPYRRAHLQRCLAQEHWELVHGGFAQGAVGLRVLESAAEHAEASLALVPSGSAAVLLARVALRQNRPQTAWRWLEQAERSGVSPAVCAPLFAEVAYAQRRFSLVGSLLARAPLARVRRPRLSPLLDFWTGRDAS